MSRHCRRISLSRLVEHIHSLREIMTCVTPTHKSARQLHDSSCRSLPRSRSTDGRINRDSCNAAVFSVVFRNSSTELYGYPNSPKNNCRSYFARFSHAMRDVDFAAEFNDNIALQLYYISFTRVQYTSLFRQAAARENNKSQYNAGPRYLR